MAGTEREAQGLNRRALLTALAASAVPAAAMARAPRLALNGQLVQGGFAMGRTAPRAEVRLDRTAVSTASVDGLFVVGFDRDAPDTAELAVIDRRGRESRRTLQIARGEFDIQRIDGLPEDQVAPTDPELLARIAREAERKGVGLESRADLDGFRRGFIMPVEATRLSGRFGGQRILNGQPSRPHYGDDLAAPVGTPVVAPAEAVVAFSESGLHFEGGLIMLDHGQGLISLYLHLSRRDVQAGEAVEQGQPLGAVGQEGRATGPHLCWRCSWRGRHLDPMLLVGAKAPGL